MFRKKQVRTLGKLLFDSGIDIGSNPGAALLEGLRDYGYLNKGKYNPKSFKVVINNDFSMVHIMCNNLLIAKSYIDDCRVLPSGLNLYHWDICVRDTLGGAFQYASKCSSFCMFNGKLTRNV